MATPTNHWKLGLFVVLGVVLGLGIALVLGARSLQGQTVKYQSYFDESVQGLDVGSVVKFRGVPLGTVSRIGVAPDRRHVEVESALDVDQINALGLATGKGKHIQISVPPGLRVQLASAGITGVKFLQLDFFPTKNNPTPALPFPVPDNYVPVEVSTMKNLEDSVVSAVDQIPLLTEAGLRVLGQLGHLLDDIDHRGLTGSAERALGKFDGAFTRLDKKLADVDTARLSKRAQGTLDDLDTVVTKVNGILSKIDGEHGAIASAQRTSDAMGDAISSVSGLGDDLSTTLRNVQRAAESIERLADALERDSDMLLKGRAKAATR